MELALLVYGVYAIGALGVLLMLAGLGFMGVYAERTIKSIVDNDNTIVDGSIIQLQSPLDGVTSDGFVEIDRYSNYCYLKGNLGKSGGVGYAELQGLLKTKEPQPTVSNKLLIIGAILFSLGILTPSKELATYMVGAYLVQQVVMSDTAKEIGTLSTEVVKNQLRTWATDNKDLQLLLESSKLVIPKQDKQE